MERISDYKNKYFLSRQGKYRTLNFVLKSFSNKSRAPFIFNQKNNFFLMFSIKQITCLHSETLRVINNKHLAAMIAKNIDSFPENTDRMFGSIDIWWIVRIFFSCLISSALEMICLQRRQKATCKSSINSVGQARIIEISAGHGESYNRIIRIALQIQSAYCFYVWFGSESIFNIFLK